MLVCVWLTRKIKKYDNNRALNVFKLWPRENISYTRVCYDAYTVIDDENRRLPVLIT